MVPGNFPNSCGLVRLAVLFAVSYQTVSGNRLLASMRTVSLNFSNAQVFVSEYCGHQTHPVRAMPLPALPSVNAAGYANAPML